MCTSESSSGRIGDGALSAERTPTTPPETTRLVPIDPTSIQIGMRVGYEDDITGIGRVVGEIANVEMIDYTAPGPPRAGRNDKARGDVWIILLDPDKREDDMQGSMMLLIWKNDTALKPAKHYRHVVEFEAERILKIATRDGNENLLIQGVTLGDNSPVEVFVYTNKKTIFTNKIVRQEDDSD